MRRLIVFNHMSLDGYFTDAAGDMSFARNPLPDAEWDAYVAGNARADAALVFGRITYELMASFWPTPAAAQAMPEMAAQMNRASKVVFSRTLKQAAWNNTRLLKDDLPREIRRMKSEPGEDLLIFGSGSLITQLAPLGLIDEFQIVLDPLALGGGRSLFERIPRRLPFQLKGARPFANGNVLLSYQPAG